MTNYEKKLLGIGMIWLLVCIVTGALVGGWIAGRHKDTALAAQKEAEFVGGQLSACRAQYGEAYQELQGCKEAINYCGLQGK